eukprot:6564015-Pyramimonas_sp.AAC.1
MGLVQPAPPDMDSPSDWRGVYQPIHIHQTVTLSRMPFFHGGQRRRAMAPKASLFTVGQQVPRQKGGNSRSRGGRRGRGKLRASAQHTTALTLQLLFLGKTVDRSTQQPEANESSAALVQQQSATFCLEHARLDGSHSR